jgi:hypothetical protein
MFTLQSCPHCGKDVHKRIIKTTQEGTIVNIFCECGFEHDDTLDKDTILKNNEKAIK